MGLQMLANCNKRNREDCLMDEDNLIPTKLCKTGGADIWEEEYYHPSGKCYQCNSTDSVNGGAGNGIFYSGSHSNEQYNSHCWSVPPPISAVTVSSSPSLSTTSSSSCCSSPNAATNGTTIVTVGPNFGSQQTINNCGMHMMGSYLHSTSSMAGAQSQQTIRCDENGKSYLDLGSGSSIVAYSSGSSSSSSSSGGSSSSSSSNTSNSSSSSSNSNSVSSSRYNNFVSGGQKAWSGGAVGDRCCSSWRTKWCMCGPACYRQRRMAVLNISMCKLGRYRQFTDPSLYRSVLICNTLRYIEREMEQEGCFNSSSGATAPNATNCATAAASQQSVGGSTSSTSAFPSQSPLIMFEPPPEPPRVPTPYPQTFPLEDNDSGLGDENKSINWGSVLSLSSQSDLDPLNNNDSLADLDFSQDLDDIVPSCKLTPLSVEDILKTMPTSSPPSITTSPSCSTKCSDSSSSSAELDTIMHVLKFS